MIRLPNELIAYIMEYEGNSLRLRNGIFINKYIKNVSHMHSISFKPIHFKIDNSIYVVFANRYILKYYYDNYNQLVKMITIYNNKTLIYNYNKYENVWNLVNLNSYREKINQCLAVRN